VQFLLLKIWQNSVSDKSTKSFAKEILDA
jgi:hypothetical protein